MGINPAWKKAERRLAELFGAKRNPLSGSNSGQSGSDSNHPTLYLEAKWRKVSSLWTLFDHTKQRAVQEGKTPVLGIFEKDRKGFLVVVHSDDLGMVGFSYNYRETIHKEKSEGETR